MFILTVSEKGGQRSTFEFEKNEVTIGRMKGNDIVLPKGNVSKRHSKIVFQANAFSIADAGSTNGTFVNGRRIQGEQIITHSDKIYIGDFILQLENNTKAVNPGSGFNPEISSGYHPNPVEASSGLNPPVNPQIRESGFVSMDPSAINLPPTGAPRPPVNVPPVNVPPVNVPPAPTFNTPAALVIPPAPDLTTPDIAIPSESAEFEGLGNISSASLNFDVGLEKPTGPRNIPIFVDPLEDNFNEELQKLHAKVIQALLKDIKLTSLPKSYPVPKGDVTKFTASVNKAFVAVNCGTHKAELETLVLAECIGLGPIDALLNDPEVLEIFVHKYDQIFVRKSGNLIRHRSCFATPEFLNLSISRLFGAQGEATQHLTLENGTQICVTLPPLSEGPVVAISKPRKIKSSFDELVADKTISASAANFLQNAVAAGKSILVTGPKNSGRTTLISALASELRNGFRTIAIEDASDLSLPEFTIRFKNNSSTNVNPIEAALQMHPDRIILDPCNTKNSYAWVNAISSGTAGSIASIFGTTTSDALGRLESMVLLGEDRLSARGVREQISRAVDVVVVLNRTEKGFRTQQISEVSGVDFDSFRTQDVFYYRSAGQTGRLHPTCYVPSFYEDLKHSGFEVDFNIFRE